MVLILGVWKNPPKNVAPRSDPRWDRQIGSSLRFESIAGTSSTQWTSTSSYSKISKQNLSFHGGKKIGGLKPGNRKNSLTFDLQVERPSPVTRYHKFEASKRQGKLEA